MKRKKSERGVATKNGVKCNIVSLRINDQEREVLEQISRTTLKSVSEIMREAMLLVTGGWTDLVQQQAYAVTSVRLCNTPQLH